MPYTTEQVSYDTDTGRLDSLCSRALSNAIPSSFCTSRLIMLVNGDASGKSGIVSASTSVPCMCAHPDEGKCSWHISHPIRDAGLSPRRIWRRPIVSRGNTPVQAGFGGYIQSTPSAGCSSRIPYIVWTYHCSGPDTLFFEFAVSFLKGVESVGRERIVPLSNIDGYKPDSRSWHQVSVEA